MTYRILVIAEDTIPPMVVNDCRTLCAQFADYLAEPVGLAKLSPARLRLVNAAMLAAGGDQKVEEIQPGTPPQAAPMSSAEFVWREDGRPDWGAMWTSFCELALYGGPPHRGEEDALGPVEVGATAEDFTRSEALQEIRRGIWETTGLYAEPAEPGWIAVTCHSPKMAAWLCASIILENVYARCEDERLYLPVSPDYRLKNEVKSIITVLAKTNHYWQAHIEALEAQARAAAERATAGEAAS
jgi:hypothetical protein